MMVFTKESLSEALLEIHKMGWIHNHKRRGNDGAIGNLIEDLLGIEENNLPLPNANDWELKGGRIGSRALTTLRHLEPSPNGMKLVSTILLPKYGWPHQKAGTDYHETELSFRQTIYALKHSSRGFKVSVDDDQKKVVISFDATKVKGHEVWLHSVAERVGLEELMPQPYWGFNDLEHEIGVKLKNLFYVKAARKRVDGEEYFHYLKAYMLENFDINKFIQAIKDGFVYVDFDARTKHNHGTKFRIRGNIIENLYEKKTTIFDF